MRLKGLALVAVACISVAAMAQRGAPPAPKDMESVRRIYLAPFTGDDAQNANFRTLLKIELVHNNFVVLDKPEGADATLAVEIISNEKAPAFEFHSALDAGPDSAATWTLSSDKKGADLQRLMEGAARSIAGGLRGYRLDVISKKQQKEKK